MTRTYDMVPLSKMEVDSRYQREVGPGNLQNIIDNFDIMAVRPITVSKRTDGFYYIIDGQCRYQACLTKEIKQIMCEVHHDLNLKDEARLFGLLNHMKVVNPRNRFRARLVAGDKVAKDILRIVRDNGFNIVLKSGRPDTKNNISAISALEKLYRLYDLPATLSVIYKATAKNGQVPASAVSNLFIEGVAKALHDLDVSMKALIDVLKERDSWDWCRSAERISNTSRKDAVDSLVKLIKKQLSIMV